MSILKLAIIIPAFNEERSIEVVVREIDQILIDDIQLETIVVNDCSTDNTRSIIDEINCEKINLPINLGIGGAVQSGYIYACKNNFDYAIQIDGDGQHPVNEIEKMLSYIINNNLDIVIGSRFINYKGFQSSLLRRTGIKYFTILNKILLGITITDCTSGFRIVNKRVMELFSVDYPDEYPEPESLVNLKLRGFKIEEIPVIMKERQGGVSSIGGLSSLYYMVKVTLAIFFTYIRLRLSLILKM